MFKKIHNYVSDADKFLKIFDQKHDKLSTAQQAEVAKHQRLAKQRDEVSDQEQSVWGEF